MLALGDLVREDPPLTSAFVAEFTRRLRGQNPGLTLPMGWLEHHLAETNQTVEQLIQLESQDQAADQVSMSNSIGSLRFLSAMDWREFVETLSVRRTSSPRRPRLTCTTTWISPPVIAIATWWKNSPSEAPFWKKKLPGGLSNLPVTGLPRPLVTIVRLMSDTT